MSSLTPNYYLTHDTPVGTRYAYPRERIPALAAERNNWPRTDPAFTVLDNDGGVIEHTLTERWLITAAEAVDVRIERPGSRVRDGWMKRAEPIADGPVSPDLRKAFDAAPERPSDGEVAHFGEHDAAHACWVCMVFTGCYSPHYIPGEPVVTWERLVDWLPLPGEPDPDPSRTWTVDDTSLLALYGRHTAHLWPGVLSGLREPVIERLKAHPLVSTLIDSISKDVRLWVHIPWETPKTRVTHVKPYRARKTVAKTVPVYAMERVLEMQFPDGVSAPSKAAAIAGFDAAVDRQVERVLPFGEDPRGCDHCQGLGWVRRA